MSPAPKIVLASTSPRRREILGRLGLPFEVVAPRYEENLNDPRPARELALFFAQEKARSVASDHPESLIIGSDTLIECAGEKIGKPRDPEDARRILRLLSGREHRIVTAVALLDTRTGALETRLEECRVVFRSLSDQEIADYVATGEPLDKAGAYAIQGGAKGFIAKFHGDPLAAVGLPLKPIQEHLASMTTF